MTPDISAIEARVKAATPGHWVAQSSDDGASDPWWIDTHAYEDGPEPVWAPPQYPVSPGDADFIAHARTDIPALLEANDQLAQQLREAEEALRRIAFTDAPRYWAQDEARAALATHAPDAGEET